MDLNGVVQINFISIDRSSTEGTVIHNNRATITLQTYITSNRSDKITASTVAETLH